MASRKTETPRPGNISRIGRRMIWLAVAILVAVAGYSAAWHYVAGQVHAEAVAAVAAVNRDGRRANCENSEVRGFPFRIGVFCRSVLYEDGRAGIGVRAQAFRSAAQIYNPRQVVAELDGPALVEIPGFNALDMNWTELRASARLEQPMPRRVSVEARGLTASADSGTNDGEALVRIETGEFHLRPNGDELDVALRFFDLVLGTGLTGGRELPPIQGLADMAIANAAEGLTLAMGLRGLSGTLRTLSLTFADDAGATISGSFEIGEDGLIDARLQLSVREPSSLAATLGEAFPEARGQIDAAFSGLAMLGDQPTLPLTIDRGEARLGFISLGMIPPVE